MSCRLQRTAGRSRLPLAQGLPGMGHVNLRLLVWPSVQTGSAKAEYPGEHSSGRVADSCCWCWCVCGLLVYFKHYTAAAFCTWWLQI